MAEEVITTNIITRPLLPLRGLLVLPGMLVNVDVGREKSMAAVRAVMDTDKKIISVSYTHLTLPTTELV